MMAVLLRRKDGMGESAKIVSLDESWKTRLSLSSGAFQGSWCDLRQVAKGTGQDTKNNPAEGVRTLVGFHCFRRSILFPLTVN